MMELCRACLSTKNDIKLINLDEELVINYNLLTSLDIKVLDGLPQYLCVTCRDVILQFVKFKEKCISSESSLKSLSPDIKIELPIKVEPKDANIQDYNPIKEELLDIKEYNEIDSSDLLNNFNGIIENDHDYIDDNECKEILRRSNRRSKKGSRNENINKGIVSKSNDNVRVKPASIPEDDDPDSLPCGLCPEIFIDKSLLSSHIESHRKDLSCEFCFENFIDWPHIVSHRICHITTKKKATCAMCWKQFKRDIYLEYHIRTTHCDIKEFKGLTCKVCLTKYYANPLKLRKHIARSHAGVLYVCNICSKSCPSKQTLKSHMKKHSSERKYVCDLCGVSYKYHGALEEHRLRKHAAEKYECKYCTRMFQKKNLFDKHSCTQLFICPMCGKESQRRAIHNRHIQSHSEERPYACDRCPATYKSKMALKVHKDRHDGNRTKQCEYCSAKFYSMSVLIKHRRVHTGEKPYVCKICKKGFTGRNNLKVHMKVHGEYLIVKKTIEVESKK